MIDAIRISHGHNWGGSFLSLSIPDKSDIEYLVRGLDSFEKSKAITEGLVKGVNVFRAKGRSNLRGRISNKSSGNLMGSFRTYSVAKLLRAKAGFTEKGSHAHLVDLGTRIRKTKSGANRGVMPANSFWRDARTSEESKALDLVYQEIQGAVQRINNRS